METEKISYEPIEIDHVPYMGAVDTHVECAKLDLCLKLKQRLMEHLQDGIICGEGDSKPLGLSRAEPPADG